MMSSLQQVNPRVKGIRVSPGPLPALCFLQGVQKPFKEVTDISSGDPHKAGMKPISFVRQVLAVCLYPELLKNKNLPLDVRLRAERLLDACDGGDVASSGISYVRQRIAEFITRRDAGVPSYPQNIFICAGFQMTLMIVVKMLSSEEGETPTDNAGVTLVPYHLREDKGWTVDLEELHRAVKTDRSSIEEVIRFAATEGLLLLVDEVYQDSVFQQGRKFISYKKVLFEMGQEYSDRMQLASFHSLSNAVMGECGLRAGYMELVNMDPEVILVVDNLLCTYITTPVTGQLALELMVNPPKAGDPSYDTYTQVRE
uniref:alanine transaminase n=1 Tax=Myripristis murdjan TaxID=586833 RepID=A0A667YFG8_9TELE